MFLHGHILGYWKIRTLRGKTDARRGDKTIDEGLDAFSPFDLLSCELLDKTGIG